VATGVDRYEATETNAYRLLFTDAAWWL